jgi:aspartyl-tRNA(Asn)/glutamyl-tRNA(Gln) amidotransferase subunit C
MPISREDVIHIARLARLDLSGEEIERMREDLAAILAYARRLEGVDTSDIELVEAGGEEGMPLRTDEPEPWLRPGEATRDAPAEAAGLFKVPPVLGGDG